MVSGPGTKLCEEFPPPLENTPWPHVATSLSVIVLGQLLMCLVGLLARMYIEFALIVGFQNGVAFLLGFATVRKESPAITILYIIACLAALVWVFMVVLECLGLLDARLSWLVSTGIHPYHGKDAAPSLLVATLAPALPVAHALLAGMGAALASRLQWETAFGEEKAPLLGGFGGMAMADGLVWTPTPTPGQQTSTSVPPRQNYNGPGAAAGCRDEPPSPPPKKSPSEPFRAILSAKPPRPLWPARSPSGTLQSESAAAGPINSSGSSSSTAATPRPKEQQQPCNVPGGARAAPVASSMTGADAGAGGGGVVPPPIGGRTPAGPLPRKPPSSAGGMSDDEERGSVI